MPEICATLSRIFDGYFVTNLARAFFAIPLTEQS